MFLAVGPASTTSQAVLTRRTECSNRALCLASSGLPTCATPADARSFLRARHDLISHTPQHARQRRSRCDRLGRRPGSALADGHGERAWPATATQGERLRRRVESGWEHARDWSMGRHIPAVGGSGSAAAGSHSSPWISRLERRVWPERMGCRSLARWHSAVLTPSGPPERWRRAPGLLWARD